MLKSKRCILFAVVHTIRPGPLLLAPPTFIPDGGGLWMVPELVLGDAARRHTSAAYHMVLDATIQRSYPPMPFNSPAVQIAPTIGWLE